MSLFEEDDAPVPVIPQQVKPKIQPKKYEGITIDTSYAPSSALLTWIEGSNWTVDYFSQVLGASSEPTPLALDREPAYQQYKRIKGMHLKVTTPISFSQDQTVLTMEVRGSGITYPFVVPSYGDMFIADIGDGRAGVFTITQATRATILKDSVYNVEYVMVSELSQDILADLERKTILTYHYSQASLLTGCGPFVTEPEQARLDRFQALYQELIERYLTDFFSQEHSTLLVPDQLRKTYDHFVTCAVLRLLDSRSDRRIRRIREMNVGIENVMGQPTLWDAVMRVDAKRIYGASERAHLVSTQYFKGRTTLQSLGYTGISRVVFPKDAPTDVDSQYDYEHVNRPTGVPFMEGRPRRPLPGGHVDQATRNPMWFQSTALVEGISPWRLPPDIHPVVKDDYYVLTEAFYRKDAQGQSKLEMLVWQALHREALNLEQLEGCLEHVYDWDNLERFYYYPLIFMLLKTTGVR